MPYPINKYKTIITVQEEKDEFAIEFLEWYELHGKWTEENLTSKTLLEKFKKEQFKNK
jgi:hypothetical protein